MTVSISYDTTLWLHQQLSSGLPTFEILQGALLAQNHQLSVYCGTYIVRSSHILERVHLMDPNIELIHSHHLEQLVRVMLELLPCIDVIEQCRPRDLDVLGRQSPSNQTPLATSSPRNHTHSPPGPNAHPNVPSARGKCTHAIVNGSTAPLAFPKLIIDPFRATHAKLTSNVLFPTPSNTTPTPSPPVTPITLSRTSSRP